MTRRLFPLVCSCVALLVVFQLPSLEAGKPAPPPTPPPTGGDPTLIYKSRPDLGGWLDTERNLIWGYYSIHESLGGSTDYDTSVNAAANYSSVLLQGAAHYEDQRISLESAGDRYADMAAIETDTDLKAQYIAKSEDYYDRADDSAWARDSLLATSLGASNVEGTDQWRMPSKAEFVDAYNKRFFTYGPGGMNALDTSALPGVQPQTNYLIYWTTTADKGSRYQWAYDPPTGTAQSVLKERSYLYGMAVRNYTPPAP